MALISTSSLHGFAGPPVACPFVPGATPPTSSTLFPNLQLPALWFSVFLPACPSPGLTNGPCCGWNLLLPASDSAPSDLGCRAAQSLSVSLRPCDSLSPASSLSQASLLHSCPSQRHGCHLMPLSVPAHVHPSSENGTAAHRVDRASDLRVVLASAPSNPTSNPSAKPPLYLCLLTVS